MQYIQRLNLKPNRAYAFHQWLAENEHRLREGAPEGWTYLGMWFTVRGFGAYDIEIRYELADYASLGSDWGTEDAQKAILETVEYLDLSRGQETYLMKSASDVKVMKDM